MENCRYCEGHKQALKTLLRRNQDELELATPNNIHVHCVFVHKKGKKNNVTFPKKQLIFLLLLAKYILCYYYFIACNE